MKKLTTQVVVLCTPLIVFLIVWALFFAIYFDYIGEGELKEDQNIYFLVAIAGTITSMIAFFILKKSIEKRNYIMEYGIEKEGIFVKASFEYDNSLNTRPNRIILKFEDREHSLAFTPGDKDVEKLSPGDKVPIKCHPENFNEIIIDWKKIQEQAKSIH